MPRFEVFVGPTLVGYSELESGDPPMGVAIGKFIPAPSYASFQPAIAAVGIGDQSHLQVSVRPSGGTALPAQGGAQILDFSAELGAEGMEVHVLGIGYPLYEELFPGHVAAYAAQFSKPA
jgi:hypothetical protein